MGVGYPPDALPGAPLGVRARTTCAHALEVHRGEALSVRATSWGAHSGVQTLRSVARSSLSHALLSALVDELALLTRSVPQAPTLRGDRLTVRDQVRERGEACEVLLQLPQRERSREPGVARAAGRAS